MKRFSMVNVKYFSNKHFLSYKFKICELEYIFLFKIIFIINYNILININIRKYIQLSTYNTIG